MDDGPIAVARKVEVSRYSIYLEEAFDSAAFLFVDVSNDLVQLLIIVHVAIII